MSDKTQVRVVFSDYVKGTPTQILEFLGEDLNIEEEMLSFSESVEYKVESWEILKE